MNNIKLSSLAWGEELSLPSSKKSDMYSHIVGARYPCRSFPLVPRLILNEIEIAENQAINILDPFMGSGTTALEANLKQFNAYGLEVDPYARLISQASVQKFSHKQLSELSLFLDNLEVRFESSPYLQSFVPDILNINHWFPKNNIIELARLKRLITEYTNDKKEFKNFLLAAFADIIRGVSFAERQSLKPYVSTRFKKTPSDVLPLFKKCLLKYIEGARDVTNSAHYGSGVINWIEGDATSFKLPMIIDAAITSPPYINAMDYVRCVKLESSWIDTATPDIFGKIRASQVGETARYKVREISGSVYEVIEEDYESIYSVDTIRAKTMAAYFEDMKLNLLCVFDALKCGGNYHIIVGNSLVRGVSVPTHEYLAKIAVSVGFNWVGYFKYQIKDHRTSLPRNGRGGKINFEHVITLKKP